MTATAVFEFQYIIVRYAGLDEQARAMRFLGRYAYIADMPSAARCGPTADQKP